MPETDRRFDAHQALAQWLALAERRAHRAVPLPAPAHSMLGDVPGIAWQLISAAIEDIADVVAGDPRWPLILRAADHGRTLGSIGTGSG